MVSGGSEGEASVPEHQYHGYGPAKEYGYGPAKGYGYGPAKGYGYGPAKGYGRPSGYHYGGSSGRFYYYGDNGGGGKWRDAGELSLPPELAEEDEAVEGPFSSDAAIQAEKKAGAAGEEVVERQMLSPVECLGDTSKCIQRVGSHPADLVGGKTNAVIGASVVGAVVAGPLGAASSGLLANTVLKGDDEDANANANAKKKGDAGHPDSGTEEQKWAHAQPFSAEGQYHHSQGYGDPYHDKGHNGVYPPHHYAYMYGAATHEWQRPERQPFYAFNEPVAAAGPRAGVVREGGGVALVAVALVMAAVVIAQLARKKPAPTSPAAASVTLV